MITRDSTMVKMTIGEKIRKRRETLGYSLRELAKMTDLSASFISQVELNRNNLSLASLHAVAAALDVPLLYFLDEKTTSQDSFGIHKSKEDSTEEITQDRYYTVVTKDSRNQLTMKKSGVTYELLVPRMGYKMVVFQRQLSPGYDHEIKRVLKEPTEEFIYVLSGELLVELTTGQYVLYPEDSMYFDGRDLLRFECHSSDQDVVWITAITPSIF
jgi:transcriptional regulator with XRE-family HTH domain